MPATSAKQLKFLAMIAHKAKGKSDKKSKGIGPSAEMADEIIRKTPKIKRKLFMKKDDKKDKW